MSEQWCQVETFELYLRLAKPPNKTRKQYVKTGPHQDTVTEETAKKRHYTLKALQRTKKNETEEEEEERMWRTEGKGSKCLCENVTTCHFTPGLGNLHAER